MERRAKILIVFAPQSPQMPLAFNPFKFFFLFCFIFFWWRNKDPENISYTQLINDSSVQHQPRVPLSIPINSNLCIKGLIISQNTIEALFLELPIQDSRVRGTVTTLLQNLQFQCSPLSLRAGQMNVSRSKCQQQTLITENPSWLLRDIKLHCRKSRKIETEYIIMLYLEAKSHLLRLS